MLGTDTSGVVCPRATELTYIDFPTYYTWNNSTKKWSRRKKPNHISDQIGRIYSAHPNSGERFYLRMLLCKVPGAQSFQHLRTVNGEDCGTFKNACLTLGILADDSEWAMCLEEAASVMGPKPLRDLFCFILHNNQPANPLKLWELQIEENFYLMHAMAEDFRYERLNGRPQQHEFPLNINDGLQQCDIDKTLYAIDDALLLLSNGQSNLHSYHLPQPTQPRPGATDPLDSEILAETSYDVPQLDSKWKEMFASFNDDQKEVFTILDDSVNNKRGEIFFLDAVGGTGKTFVFNALLAK